MNIKQITVETNQEPLVLCWDPIGEGLGPSLTKLVYVVETADMVYEMVMNEDKTFDRCDDSRVGEKN